MGSATTDRRMGLAGNTAYKTPATALASTNIVLSGEQTVGGVAVKAINAAGFPDRVLCIGQSDLTTNGLWDVSTGPWSRSVDGDGNYDWAQGSQVLIAQGSAAFQIWTLTTANPITVGSTQLLFSPSINAGNMAALAASSGSSLVGHLPEGTGALPTTVQDELRQMSVNVKRFGAVGDGVTDDTAAINAAIMVAQKLKANQLSYDEIYSVEVVFKGGKDYKVIGPILLPSGIALNGRGCRLIGNYASAATAAYVDANPSIIETAYYDGTTITTNRAAALNTKRVVGSAIRNFAFVNANCGINAVQFNERSVIENVTFSNCSATMRFKNSYYGSVNGARITGCSQFANQYTFSIYGGNANAMQFRRISFGSGVSVGIAISGSGSSGTSIVDCTFEQSATGTGIYFASDAYCSGWDISRNYFEGVQTAINLVAGAGTYGIGINNNYFDSCQYALVAAASSLRVATFLGNSQPDGGGIIRNLLDISAIGNDVRFQMASKSGNNSAGTSSYLSNVLPGAQGVAQSTSTWTRTTGAFDAIGRALPALANQNALNELPFEGANIITVANEPPFVSLTRAVNTLTINTQITYDLSNVLVFNFYGATDSVAFDLKGFIFGTTVSWVTHTPVGVSLTVNNNGGYVQIVFGSLTAAVPVINVSGMVRHV